MFLRNVILSHVVTKGRAYPGIKVLSLKEDQGAMSACPKTQEKEIRDDFTMYHGVI
jgi:hypothetical protein